MNESILEAKKATVDRLTKDLVNAKCVVVVSYSKLDVASINTLRKDLKKNAGKMEVAKNTLVKRALDGENFKALDVLLKGPNALITSDHETTALNTLFAFTMIHPEMEIKGAVIGGSYCDKAKTKLIASIPDEKAAISTLVGVLSMPVIQFACALKAYAESKNA